ncbi:hypothetical protein JST97_35010 [bacterium]|nr:hypothetical protein [bacterium]
MMIIQACLQSLTCYQQRHLLRAAANLFEGASPLCQDRLTLSPQAMLAQGQDFCQHSMGLWLSVLRPESAGLAQPQELSRNQQTTVGCHTMQVDAGGNITVATAPAQVSMGGFSESGAWGARSLQGEAPLKFSNGTVQLPNGEKRPYGNTGVIVVMADGRQFAAGRNSKDSNENIRYVAADKGQEIPVSPPGNTTVLYLDAQGNVERQETR